MLRLILAAFMGTAIAGAADAATIVQDRAFNVTLSSVTEPGHYLISRPFGATNQEIYAGTKSFASSFDPFDLSLGTLQGVSLTLQSTYAQTASNSLLVIGQLGTGAIAAGSAGMAQNLTLALNGRTVFEKQFSVDVTFGDCQGLGTCRIEMQNDGTFDRVAARDPTDYLGDDPIDFDLTLKSVQQIFFEPNPPDYPPDNEQGPFGFRDLSEWGGVLQLTYHYDPAVAPTPTTIPAPGGIALLLAGLAGLIAKRAGAAA